jgi:VanZ family protein
VSAIPPDRRASGSRSARRRSWAVLASLWAVLVWLVLTWPPPPSAPDLRDWLLWPLALVADKLGHAALFLVQALLLHRALRAEGRPAPGGRALTAAVALALLYGGATELRQRDVEGREADPWDFAADAAGAIGYAVAVRRSGLRERVAARGGDGGARGLAGRRGGG